MTAEGPEGFFSALRKTYDAECLYLQEQSRMIEAVEGDELLDAALDALDSRRGQVLNLEQVFIQLGESPEREENGVARDLVACGMVRSAQQADFHGDDLILEMLRGMSDGEATGYSVLIAEAERLGLIETAELLGENLLRGERQGKSLMHDYRLLEEAAEASSWSAAISRRDPARASRGCLSRTRPEEVAANHSSS